MQQQWFSLKLEGYKDWKFDSTENGWTSDATTLEWLKTVFIPQIAPRDPKEPRLLILDGYKSHETIEFIWEYFKNNIHLLFLLLHTSYVLQLLDLLVFFPLKHAYWKRLGALASLNDSTLIRKQNFMSCYKLAREDTLTVTNCKQGWSASGL